MIATGHYDPDFQSELNVAQSQFNRNSDKVRNIELLWFPGSKDIKKVPGHAFKCVSCVLRGSVSKESNNTVYIGNL